ncbi:MAG: hypothetical protein ACOYVF_11660 [Candidatus Zixiibacteriota bacterium]
MLECKYHRGFSTERLESIREPKVRRDEKGFYIMTLSENTKVYFEDFYTFLELTYEKALREKEIITDKIASTSENQNELRSYYRAKSVIIDLLLKTVRRFYTDGSNFGIIMTPWCFGTVMLEKIEVYRERLSRGEVSDSNIVDYPYYVIRYIDEIYKTILLEMFDFPEQAFQMRWQYSELLKRYSKVLTDITDSLQSVIKSVKNLGSK